MKEIIEKTTINIDDPFKRVLATCAYFLIHKGYADKFLREGYVGRFRTDHIKLIHTLEYSQGNTSLLMKNKNVVLTGDIMFAGSIGKTVFMVRPRLNQCNLYGTD